MWIEDGEERVVQRIEERQLDQQRQTTLHRVDAVGLIERLLLGHLPLRIVRKLGLNLLQLGRISCIALLDRNCARVSGISAQRMSSVSKMMEIAKFGMTW